MNYFPLFKYDKGGFCASAAGLPLKKMPIQERAGSINLESRFEGRGQVNFYPLHFALICPIFESSQLERKRTVGYSAFAFLKMNLNVNVVISHPNLKVS